MNSALRSLGFKEVHHFPVGSLMKVLVKHTDCIEGIWAFKAYNLVHHLQQVLYHIVGATGTAITISAAPDF